MGGNGTIKRVLRSHVNWCGEFLSRTNNLKLDHVQQGLYVKSQKTFPSVASVGSLIRFSHAAAKATSVGALNRFSHAAAKAASEGRRQAWRPVLVRLKLTAGHASLQRDQLLSDVHKIARCILYKCFRKLP